MRNIFSQKPDDGGLENPSGAPAPETAVDAGESGASQDAAFAALNSECVRLEKELAEHRENLLRRQAEFDNYRRRTERERAEFRVTARMDAVMDMLPVLDGLEAALKAPIAPGHAAGAAEMRKGVELVEKQMREILEKMGMKRIDALGQPFDPQLHHAVELVPTEAHEDHTVIGVFQQGYLFQDKLLRPAMVRVASRATGEDQK
jgi:molecular chaperone GrpE